MKDYLKRLARGNFIYDAGRLEFSQERLTMQVTEQTIQQGTFSFAATQAVKGLIWSQNERVVVHEHAFSGTQMDISYSVNAMGLHSRDMISGCFYLITSAGEAQVPYDFKVVEETVQTSTGSASNMFHFANLVQTAQEEAETVFLGERFKTVFLKTDYVLANVYDLISAGSSLPEAMEEFLIAAHKKMPVQIRISEEKKRYADFQADLQDSIVITKSGWGYISIQISTDCPFIRLSSLRVTTEDFTGGRYAFDYVLERQKMHAGRNFGRIFIRTFNQELEISVEADCAGMPHIAAERRMAVKKLTQEYLDYRMKKSDMAGWISHSNQILDRIRGMGGDHVYFQLVQAQLYLAQRRQQEGEWLLEHVKNELDISRLSENVQNVELYCYYLYVNSMAVRDEAYTAKAAQTVRQYYENGYDTWRILWLLSYLDIAYSRNQSIKLIRIKDVCHDGCASPIMYMEALSIMNAQPALVRVLNRFEQQVLYFGCKYGLITEKLAHHAAELIGNEKIATAPMLRILYKLNETFMSDDLLNVLVTHMIRNELADSTCFRLYEKGILRGLRITQLYEYYIKSMDKSKMNRLPKMVLMYFAYDSALDVQAKAYLYANVLVNESRTPEMMNIYMPQIERFGYEQLKNGRVDDNLLIIYKKIWNAKLVDEQTAGAMIKLMFTYKVTCFGTQAQSVVVKHKELKSETKYPLVGGTAYVQMYTEGCGLVFEDASGVRRRDSIQYELERVFEDESLLGVLKEHAADSVMLRLYLYESRKRTHMSNEDTLENVLVLMRHPQIDKNTLCALNSWLIAYYDAFFTGDDFAALFKNIQTEGLSAQDAVKLIEVCVSQGLCEDAYDLVRVYGFEHTAPVKMFRLARRILELRGLEEDALLTAICSYIFENKKYNEEILQYMVLFYNGTNEQMYGVWKACQNFRVESQQLAERIIAQMLFTGEHNGRLTEVFGSYCSNGARNVIVEAYTAYHAFLHFVKQKKANDIVFKVLEQQLADSSSLPDVCKLSLLKHYAAKAAALTPMQQKMAQELLDEMCHDNKIFEFYKKFAGVLVLPYNMIDQTVVEYRANPAGRVEIHYAKNGEEEMTTEVMQCVGGVFVKNFTLFYGESLQYYFTEEQNGQEVCSETASLLCSNLNPEQTEGRFDYINDILASRELHDIVTMKKLMHGYSVQEYVVQQLFKPMQP